MIVHYKIIYQEESLEQLLEGEVLKNKYDVMKVICGIIKKKTPVLGLFFYTNFMKVDFIIVGQGIAGTCFAFELLQKQNIYYYR